MIVGRYCWLGVVVFKFSYFELVIIFVIKFYLLGKFMILM